MTSPLTIPATGTEQPSFLKSANSQIHAVAWALLHLVMKDQGKNANSKKSECRCRDLAVLVKVLFNQTLTDDKDAFDLYDAIQAVRFPAPLEVSVQFVRRHTAWRLAHPYAPTETAPVSLPALGHLKTYEATHA